MSRKQEQHGCRCNYQRNAASDREADTMHKQSRPSHANKERTTKQAQRDVWIQKPTHWRTQGECQARDQRNEIWTKYRGQTT